MAPGVHGLLEGGLVLRDAGADDVAQLLARCREAFGPGDEPAVRRVLDRHGPGAFVVVADGEQVVSCACLLPRTVRVDGYPVPAGQIEFVVTHPDYRRRGLIRAITERLHGRSADHGHLLQLIVGIPYLYRRLGYGRAPAAPPRLQLRRGADLAMPEGWRARPATPDDADALAALHTGDLARAQVSTDRDPALWPSLLSWPGEERILLAERRGEVGAYARSWTRQGRSWTFEAVAADRTAARALLSGLADDGAPPHEIAITDRPGTPLGTVLVDAAVPLDQGPCPYTRVVDPVALLSRLRGPLSDRLAASDFADGAVTLRLNWFSGGARIHASEGRVTRVEPAEGCQELLEDATNLPPERVPELLLGAHDPLALDALDPDVRCWRTRAVTGVLFPARTAAVSAE